MSDAHTGSRDGDVPVGAVADLIRELEPDRFLALGDLQYNNGKLSEFLRVWDVRVDAGNEAFGTLQMSLHADSYDYRWISAPGQPAFDDSGSAACH